MEDISGLGTRGIVSSADWWWRRTSVAHVVASWLRRVGAGLRGGRVLGLGWPLVVAHVLLLGALAEVHPSGHVRSLWRGLVSCGRVRSRVSSGGSIRVLAVIIRLPRREGVRCRVASVPGRVLAEAALARGSVGVVERRLRGREITAGGGNVLGAACWVAQHRVHVLHLTSLGTLGPPLLFYPFLGVLLERLNHGASQIPVCRDVVALNDTITLLEVTRPY